MDASIAEAGIQGHLYFVPILIVVGVAAGYVAGLFGIGGGTFSVPFYRYFQYPLKRAYIVFLGGMTLYMAYQAIMALQGHR